jgi:hypothetical protein
VSRFTELGRNFDDMLLKFSARIHPLVCTCVWGGGGGRRLSV